MPPWAPPAVGPFGGRAIDARGAIVTLVKADKAKQDEDDSFSQAENSFLNSFHALEDKGRSFSPTEVWWRSNKGC